MEITALPETGRLSLPLPIYASSRLADAHGSDGEEFEIVAGLGKPHVEQLREYSLDETDVELQKNTSDKKRFGDGSTALTTGGSTALTTGGSTALTTGGSTLPVPSGIEGLTTGGPYEEWYAKNRTPFGLIHKKTGTLAAFVWFGPKPIGKKNLENLSGLESETDGEKESGEWHTIGYRSYALFRGKGLMKDFARFAMKIYSVNRPDVHYWVGINPENKASIALAASLGFTVSEEFSDRPAGWLVMTNQVP